MRIGLYGGVANNMYVFAHALARCGEDVLFIRDRADRYPFSQPSWEDAAWTLSYDEMNRAASWPWQEWTRRETEVSWRAPRWLFDPLDAPTGGDVPMRADVGWFNRLLLRRLARRWPHWPAALEAMARCDALVACGIEGALLAWISGKPFLIWPHGGDIRLAAGLQPPASRQPVRLMAHVLLRRLLRRAYGSALAVGSHDPSGVGVHLGDPIERLGLARFERVPVPLPIRARADRPERRRRLEALLGELGIAVPQAEVIALVPSRIDFQWKRQDRLLRALTRASGRKRLHIIVCGWGRDYEAARRMAPPESVTFLPFAVSKPLLYRLFESVDLVIDQFILGIYGTSVAEAMSCGTPVLTWINTPLWQTRGWDPPPVLNAVEESEIAEILRRIAEGNIDLEEHGQTTLEWASRVHGERVVVPRIVELLSEGCMRSEIQDVTCRS